MSIDLTERTARELSHAVVKQSHGVSVRTGRTNGRPILHLIQRENPSQGREAASETIASAAEWNLHRWNTANAPRKRRDTEEGLGLVTNDIIANKEAQ